MVPIALAALGIDVHWIAMEVVSKESAISWRPQPFLSRLLIRYEGH
jgi:hypothetical protein